MEKFIGRCLRCGTQLKGYEISQDKIIGRCTNHNCIRYGEKVVFYKSSKGSIIRQGWIQVCQKNKNVSVISAV